MAKARTEQKAPTLNGLPPKKSGTYTITPEKAQVILDRHNRRNRKISPSHVRRLSAAMDRGAWRECADTLGFDHNGVLVDGQHRLAAVVDCGVPQVFNLVVGLHPDVVFTMDQGITRTAANALEIKGERNAGVLAGAIKLQWRYDGEKRGRDSSSRMQNDQVLAVLRRNSGLRNSAEFVCELKDDGGVVPNHVLAFVHYHASKRDADRANAFAREAKGVGAFPGSPPDLLRDRLLNMRMRRESASPWAKTAWAVKAWNAYIEGRPLKLLRWAATDSEGRAAERFPQFAGSEEG